MRQIFYGLEYQKGLFRTGDKGFWRKGVHSGQGNLGLVEEAMFRTGGGAGV